MVEEIVCPECGSSNVLFSKKRQLHICEDCAHQFTLCKDTLKRRVFISYGHDGYASFALQLKKDLEDRGYAAWFDLERIKGGGDWERYIEDGLEWVSEFRGEGRFVLLMTPHSVRKPDGYCLNELARALQRRLHVIPVMVLDAEPPASIHNLRWLDMRDCAACDNSIVYAEKLSLLVDILESMEMPSVDDSMVKMVGETGGIASPKPETSNFSKPKRVYIGHGPGENETLAARLQANLKARGFDVWFDPEGIKSDHEAHVEEGLAWTAAIPEEGCYILLMAPRSIRRPDGTCLTELARARKKNLRVIPVMVSMCEPPLSICRTQWIDMRDCVPVEQKRDKYNVKLGQLYEALETGNLDHEGVQSRLLHVLEPLPFEADIGQHMLKFTGRKWILDMVERWLDDENGPRILWMTGLPGSGKSAIAAYLCSYRPEVAAIHLCKHDNAQRSDVRRCIESIAYQLSTQMPEYQAGLNGLPLESIVASPDNAQLFQRLIVEPLSRLKPRGARPLLIVIDSIDQAGQVNNDIAMLISSVFLHTPPWLRLFITSRPDPPILAMLKGIEPVLLDITSADNERDLRDLIHHELCTKYSCPSAMVDEAVEAIVEKSEGNMLYVDFICREIVQGRLALKNLDEFPKGLGGAFAKFFIRQFPSIDEYKTRYRSLLELIVAAMAPLPIEVAAAALEKDEFEILDLSDHMGSLFPRTDGRIRPFHRSLVDWLSYADRAGQYFVSPSKGHARLAEHGMREYRAGVKSMSLYMLAYLPDHLARSSRMDDLREVLSNPLYLGRLAASGARKPGELARYEEMLAPFVKK